MDSPTTVSVHQPAPPGVPCSSRGRPAGVLLDHGTGKRIPFPVWYDPATGWYEAFRLAPNGHDFMADDRGKPIRYKARAVGRLELVSVAGAESLGIKRKPAPVKPVVETIDRGAGLDVYKKIFVEVWQSRGLSRRSTEGEFERWLGQHDFLDQFVIKRRHIRTT